MDRSSQLENMIQHLGKIIQSGEVVSCDEGEKVSCSGRKVVLPRRWAVVVDRMI